MEVSKVRRIDKQEFEGSTNLLLFFWHGDCLFFTCNTKSIFCKHPAALNQLARTKEEDDGAVTGHGQRIYPKDKEKKNTKC
jgi:hypothetical protein